jgi:general secretion pathway protein N
MRRITALFTSRKKLWIPLGLVLFLIFAIANIPATWGGYFLTRGTGVALSGVTGTLWDGRASLASFRTPVREYSLGQLSWQLRPLSILALSPCAKVTTRLPQQQFDGEVCAAPNGAIKIGDADISVPSIILQTYLPIPIQGQFSSHIDHLQLRGNVLQALKGNLTWNSAKVNTGSAWLEVGSYAAELSDNGNNGIKARFFELAGPMDVNLDIELTAPSGGRINGTLAAPKAFFESANALDMLAMFAQEEKVDEEGKTHFRVDMNL